MIITFKFTDIVFSNLLSHWTFKDRRVFFSCFPTELYPPEGSLFHSALCWHPLHYSESHDSERDQLSALVINSLVPLCISIQPSYGAHRGRRRSAKLQLLPELFPNLSTLTSWPSSAPTSCGQRSPACLKTTVGGRVYGGSRGVWPTVHNMSIKFFNAEVALFSAGWRKKKIKCE